MRMRLPTLLLAAALAAAATLPLVSSADAPLARQQAPGFYRTMVGDYEVTVLSDGTLKLPVLQLLRGDAARNREALRRSFLADEVDTSVNAFLVNTGSRLVLVDTGAGTAFGPTLGKLLASLRAAGYRPEQVDEIYITHMHGDHVGGLMAGNQRAFPNAVLRIDKRDTDYWLSEANMNAAPEDARDFFRTAMATVIPYREAGKLRTFEGSTQLAPGIRSQSAYGHTPGHTVYVVESKGEKLVLWGDLMHVAAVQFPDPSVTIAFDTDSPQAAAARAQAYADAGRGGYMVGAAHLAFPGMGHLAAEGSGYRFVPLNYNAQP
jgi:glyoxylase-like metal-dependent hydrolase (beta-lactamase superfamily II)